MNGRLDFAPLQVRIAAVVGAEAARVGTVFDHDYIQAYKNVRPAVWIGAQRSSKISRNALGFSGQYRQTDKVDVLVRVLIDRFKEGDVNVAGRLKTLVDLTVDALIGWQAPGAEKPFEVEGSQDGSPVDSMLAVDLIFTTSVTYGGAPKT